MPPSLRASSPKHIHIHIAVAELRAYWEMGHASLEQDGERVKYGTSSERLRKARVFASRYTPSQLERLIEKCLKYQNSVGISFVDRLATIHNRQERGTLETKVVQENWSRARLDREIRSRYGRRRRISGRKPYVPHAADEALSELVRLTLKLTRWGEMMGWDPSSGSIQTAEEANAVTLADLPEDVLAEARKALRATQRLLDAAEAALQSRSD